jgi:phospholipase C
MAPKIEHVIVLMMENRSFDHLLGSTFNPGDLPNEPQAEYSLGVDPDHSHRGVMWQLLGGAEPEAPPPPIATAPLRMNGFAASYEGAIDGEPGVTPEHVLRVFSPERVPVLTTLARGFSVCTRWFCSVPGQTWPNRNFVHAATSDGEVDIVYRPYWNTTIFELLEDADHEWRIYHQGPTQTWVFPKIWVRPFRDNFRDLDELVADIRAGDLPSYTFVEPDQGIPTDQLDRSSSQHPANNIDNGRDFCAGERLIHDIYTALRESPAVFQKTLFVILYDEHGGFADHVVPPRKQAPAVPPDEEGLECFGFDVLGPRVPAVLVSPWIEAGTVDENDYEHSSIPRTIREIFRLDAPFLTRREEVARSVLDNLRLAAPRTQNLPETFPPVDPTPAAVAVPEAVAPPRPLDEFRESLVRLTRAVEEQLDRERAIEPLDVVVAATPMTVSIPPPPAFATEGERRRYVREVIARFRTER